MKLLKIAPYAFIACFVVAVDQIAKRAVLGAIGIGGRPVAVIDGFFYITCHRNSGAAFGMLQNGRVPLLVLTTAALIAIPAFMLKMRSAFARVALSFVMGGAIGNYIDRLADNGGVVDFLDFYIFGYNFPTFNAADSAIVFGFILLMAYILFVEPGRAARSAAAGGAEGGAGRGDAAESVAAENAGGESAAGGGADGGGGGASDGG